MRCSQDDTSPSDGVHHDRRALHSVLTAIAAGNDDVAAVIAQINHVTHRGEKCTSLAE